MLKIKNIENLKSRKLKTSKKSRTLKTLKKSRKLKTSQKNLENSKFQ